ncbi:MAG: deoxyribonuclease IV [Treponema sp.]|mgnify:CR=1 FL=1|nr:deoxyribonuclease IV [Treponema sp.]
MFSIGCHLSSSNGFEAMGKTALKIGANTFQFFTRNPRGSQAKDIDAEDARKLCNILTEHNFAKLVAHAPYTLNPASSRPEVREFAKITMKNDLERMEYVPGNYYNFHPGSHTGLGVEQGIEHIITLLNLIITEEQKTIVLLEGMAGKGSEIGSKFEELAEIIDGVKLKHKIGVCLDTCHLWEAGYDIKNNLDSVLDDFDKTVGLEKLYAIHLNDSKNELGASKDRHEKIGEGNIGLDAIIRIINHEKLRNLPFNLETPNELDGYEKEIYLLKNARQSY